MVTEEYDQVADLLTGDYHVIHQSRRAEDGTGCSIASRLPPVEVNEIDLCVTARVDPAVPYQGAWERIHGGASGHTFTTDNPLTLAEADWSRIPPRRIDYVLVRCDARGPTLQIDSCRLLFDRPVGGTWASDHFGVTADLVG